MSTVMFYEKPVFLNRELHRAKKIAPAQSLAFSKNANSVYLVGTEFAEACKEYPIVFTTVAGGKLASVALLGFRTDENLLLGSDGKWKGKYLPAFIRRYPFVLADMDGDQKSVCIDEAYSGFNDETGEALFDADGSNTPFFQSALDFLNQYQTEYVRTEQFCQRLSDAGLLTEMNAKADLYDGSSYSLNGFLVVDEKKLLALTDSKALEIFRAGELSWIYAHLISLSNMNSLVERLADVRRTETAVVKPTKKTRAA